MTRRIIYQGHGYVAAIAGYKAVNGPFLSVTRKGAGKYLSGLQALEWAGAIDTAIDNQERAALCRAVYNA